MRHLSFGDHLIDPPANDNPFRVDEKNAHRELGHGCIAAMGKGLKDYSFEALDEGPLDMTNQLPLPPEVEYLCRYWVHHLDYSQSLNAAEINKIYLFLKKNLLLWLQSMSLLGRAPETVSMIDTLTALIMVNIRRRVFRFT